MSVLRMMNRAAEYLMCLLPGDYEENTQRETPDYDE